jgi:light-regulated signal transduction histidine kinase (bacteriophytochrome)
MKNQGPRFATQTASQDAVSVHDFISQAVHDLREPLRGIRLGSRLLLDGGRDPANENAIKGSQYLVDSVERMETLIHDIAEYCYEEVRNGEFEEADLERVLSEVRREMAGELKSCGATIAHDPLPIVTGDPASLATVFRCLIGNACKFRSQAELCIHVGAVRKELGWTFSIRDNGMGFDPAYRERIFRPFEKLNGKQYPGSGLGLTLAKKIIEHHGGRIWAESQPGGGATICFSLPVAS